MLSIPRADPILTVSVQLDQALRQAEGGTLTPDAWIALVSDEEALEDNLLGQAEILTASGDFGAAGQLYAIIAELNDRMASLIDFLIDHPLTDGPDPEELDDLGQERKTLTTFARALGLVLTAIAQRLSISPGESEASAKEASRLFKSLAVGDAASPSAPLALLAEGVQFAAVAMSQQLRFQYRDAARSYLKARRAAEKALEMLMEADIDDVAMSLPDVSTDINTYHAAAELADLLADTVDGDFEGAVTHAEEMARITSSQDDPSLSLVTRQSLKVTRSIAMGYLAYAHAEAAASNHDWAEAERRIAEADQRWHQVVMMAVDMDIPQSGQIAATAQTMSSQTIANFRRRISRENALYAEIAGLRAENQALQEKIFQLARGPKIQAEVVGKMTADHYNTDRSQVGAMGPYAVSNTRMQQRNTGNALSGVDMAELARQLRVLTEQMKERAVNPEQYAALSEVSYAAYAASRQNKKRTLEHLKKAGAWALQVASDIGVQVAASALTAAL